MDRNTPPPEDTELPSVVAALVLRATQGDIGERRAAIAEIYHLAYKVGPKVASAIPALIGGLLDADTKIGESSLWALGYCRPDSIAPLVECLAHPQAFVRERAAHALGNIGDEARAAAPPSLRRLLADENQAVRRRAAWALGLLHDADRAAMAPLIHLVSHGTTEDRSAALQGARLRWPARSLHRCGRCPCRPSQHCARRRTSLGWSFQPPGRYGASKGARSS